MPIKPHMIFRKILEFLFQLFLSQRIQTEWCKFTTVKKATKVKGQYKVINRKQGGQRYHIFPFISPYEGGSSTKWPVAMI
ncbi:hypothetical protein DERF_013144 [Dermatophagoides farinae]|uniref:Secreted protein n=1 Tax=Dermatophagoides farinae TaxID=6954 RepID=A0A922HLF2_DERFA|nr:hypothetical protein DERF_013144 [Dermatophagoides farinae]